MAKCGVLENLLLKEHTHTFCNAGGDVRELDFRFFIGDKKIGAPFHGLRAFFTTPQVQQQGNRAMCMHVHGGWQMSAAGQAAGCKRGLMPAARRSSSGIGSTGGETCDAAAALAAPVLHTSVCSCPCPHYTCS